MNEELVNMPMSEEARLERLITLRKEFLGFLTKRLADPAAAEDILQASYAKAIEHGHGIRDDESTVPWFYRLLRNALIDHYRRRAVRDKTDTQYASEAAVSCGTQLEKTVCACIQDVVRDLKGEYREAIERIDLGGQTVEEFARAREITANNASVRLHRARKAIAKELTALCGACAKHKCLDCTCKRSQL